MIEGKHADILSEYPAQAAGARKRFSRLVSSRGLNGLSM